MTNECRDHGLVWRQLDQGGHEWVQYVTKRVGNARYMGGHCNRCGNDYAKLFGRHQRNGEDVSCPGEEVGVEARR